MTTGDDIGFPDGSPDERELLLQWLGYGRGAVLRNLDGLEDHQARWTPDGKLLPLLGIVYHLTRVEWRWVDGGFGGVPVHRSEEEFGPGRERGLDEVVAAYRARADATDAAVRAHPLTEVGTGWAAGRTLRFVLLHLTNETARHAGHADATRELLDGTTGE
jgi:uncharacterized damage-inducible protein DinB